MRQNDDNDDDDDDDDKSATQLEAPQLEAPQPIPFGWEYNETGDVPFFYHAGRDMVVNSYEKMIAANNNFGDAEAEDAKMPVELSEMTMDTYIKNPEKVESEKEEEDDDDNDEKWF